MSRGAYEARSATMSGLGWLIGIGLFVGILAFPAPTGLPPEAQRVAAVTALMALLWLTQAIPIAATSLIPLVAFPLLGIQSARGVSSAYINENVFLYLGGFIIALGVERWGLHRRFALHIVRRIGSSPKRVVLGFMLATGFLSMWISNTASTLLMLPIGLALLVALHEVAHEHEEAGDTPVDPVFDPALQKLAAVLMLGIAYSASIGGLTTLVGTPTNIAFLQIWRAQFPHGPEISAGQWMIMFVPLGAVMLLAAWRVLVFRLPMIPGAERMDRQFFTRRLQALGRPGRGEWLMLVIFTTTALLWIFRTPFQIGAEPLLPGWGGYTERLLIHWGVPAESTGNWIDDSTVAMAMALLCFCLPVDRGDSGRVRWLMDWKTAERLPWGILLLFGGGFAIADGFRTSGLSIWVGREFADVVGGAPPWLLVMGVCFLLTFLTEFTSNVATVSALLPILAGAAISLEIDPRLLMIPATLSTSCAFMLPIATPPNAIVFGSGHVSMTQMVRYGILLNLLGVLLTTLATFLLLIPQQEIRTDRLPEWAASASGK